LQKYFEYLIYKYFLGEIKENRQNAHTLFQIFIYNSTYFTVIHLKLNFSHSTHL